MAEAVVEADELYDAIPPWIVVRYVLLGGAKAGKALRKEWKSYDQFIIDEMEREEALGL